LRCGQFEKADEKLAKTLSLIQAKETVESAPVQFARCYVNIALVRTFQGRYEEALVLARQAESPAIKVFGEASGNTIDYRFLIDRVLTMAGRYSESLTMNESLLTISIHVNGKRNEHTVTAYNGTGIAHFRMGHFSEAE
jgi:hypothetical protein